MNTKADIWILTKHGQCFDMGNPLIIPSRLFELIKKNPNKYCTKFNNFVIRKWVPRNLMKRGDLLLQYINPICYYSPKTSMDSEYNLFYWNGCSIKYDGIYTIATQKVPIIKDMYYPRISPGFYTKFKGCIGISQDIEYMIKKITLIILFLLNYMITNIYYTYQNIKKYFIRGFIMNQLICLKK